MLLGFYPDMFSYFVHVVHFLGVNFRYFVFDILIMFDSLPNLFQVERWAKQYLLSTGEGKSRRNPKMLELADWLRQHIPLEDSSGSTAGLVHGDFRIDNVVFHPIEVQSVKASDTSFCSLYLNAIAVLSNACQMCPSPCSKSA